MKMIYYIIPVIAGWILDLIIGDPHCIYHPVRLIGWLIGKLDKMLYKDTDSNRKKYYKGMLEYGLLIRQDEINRYNKQIYECMRNGQFLMIPYIKRKIYNCERVIDEIKDALLNYEKTYGKGR